MFDDASNVSSDPWNYVTGRLYFNKKSHMLSADVSGDGDADFAVYIKGMTSLQASDFNL